MARRSQLRMIGLAGRHGRWRVPGPDLVRLGGGAWIGVAVARPRRQGKLPLVPTGEVFPSPRTLGERRYVGPRIMWPPMGPYLFKGSWRPNHYHPET